jgi:hypothetical protein
VGVGGLTVSGVSRNRGGFVKCVAIQKSLGIPALERDPMRFYGLVISMGISYFLYDNHHHKFVDDITRKNDCSCAW